MLSQCGSNSVQGLRTHPVQLSQVLPGNTRQLPQRSEASTAQGPDSGCRNPRKFIQRSTHALMLGNGQLAEKCKRQSRRHGRDQSSS